MKNKVLIELVVPILEEKFDVYIPINKKIGNVIILLSKVVGDLSGGYFQESEFNTLYDGITGDSYGIDMLVRESNIRNGSKLILM
ncbi:MAG: hypothetical protein HFJ11_01395 [Bacilli bacterium]|mgnify:CR=1 FL=1|nr:hypothetical protein [Bacilli bacterium]